MPYALLGSYYERDQDYVIFPNSQQRPKAKWVLGQIFRSLLGCGKEHGNQNNLEFLSDREALEGS